MHRAQKGAGFWCPLTGSQGQRSTNVAVVKPQMRAVALGRGKEGGEERVDGIKNRGRHGVEAGGVETGRAGDREEE